MNPGPAGPTPALTINDQPFQAPRRAGAGPLSADFLGRMLCCAFRDGNSAKSQVFTTMQKILKKRKESCFFR